MNSRDVVFIIGSGRSGSSALARVLSLCGFDIPQPVFGADDQNPRGFWEPAIAANLNLDFLQQQGWMTPSSTNLHPKEIVYSKAEREAYVSRIREFLAECPDATPLVIKEPLINELTEFWFDAASREQFSIHVIITIRPPCQVLASETDFALARGWPLQSAQRQSVWWLRTNLLAERQTRALPRVFVDYLNLMRDWRLEVSRIAGAFSIRVSIDGSAVDQFLSPDLHRQRSRPQIPETVASSLMHRTYRILCEAAQEKPLDTVELDNIYREYCTCETVNRELRAGVDLQPLREYLGRRPLWKLGMDYL